MRSTRAGNRSALIQPEPAGAPKPSAKVGKPASGPSGGAPLTADVFASEPAPARTGGEKAQAPVPQKAVFETNEPALPSPVQLAVALRELPPGAFAADADALFAAGERSGAVRDGKLFIYQLKDVPDRRLHAAATRMVFDTVQGATREELCELLRTVLRIDSSGLGRGELSLSEWGHLASDRERALSIQALRQLGMSEAAATGALLNGPGLPLPRSLPAEAFGRGLSAVEDSLVLDTFEALVVQHLGPDEHRTHDPIAELTAEALRAAGMAELPAEPTARRALLVDTLAQVMRNTYANPDGALEFRFLGCPGKAPGSIHGKSMAQRLYWEAAIGLGGQDGADLRARREFSAQFERMVGEIAAGEHRPADEIRPLVLRNLEARAAADARSSSVAEQAGFSVDASTGAMRSLEAQLLPLVREWNEAFDSICKTLPMIDRAKARIPDGAFKDHLVLTIQHQLGAFVPLVDALLEKGAAAADIVNVGVPYSSNAQVEVLLKQRGMSCSVAPSVDDMKPLIAEAMERLIGRARAEGKPILVIDDGGTVTELLQEKFPGETRHFRIVEQTTRGITAAQRAMDKGGFSPPGIVDIARSDAKGLEGAQLTPSAMAAIETVIGARAAMTGHPVKSLGAARPAVLGFGVVGAAQARALKELGQDVGVWDPSAQKRQQAREEGFFVPERRQDLYAGRDLVIGASGFDSIRAEDLVHAEKDTLFLSLSSKRVEFDENIRKVLAGDSELRAKLLALSKLPPQERAGSELAGALEFAQALRGAQKLGSYAPRATFGLDEQLDRGNQHQLMRVLTEAGPGPIIVNGMQPVNFMHRVFVVDPEDIQLTGALLLDGAHQAALQPDASGFVPYDRARQAKVLADWELERPET